MWLCPGPSEVALVGWRHVVELARLDGGDELGPLRSRAVQHLVIGEMVAGAEVYCSWTRARHDLNAHVVTSPPGPLSAASFLSSSASEWATRTSCAVGVGRRTAIRLAGSATATSQVVPYLVMISARVGPGGMPGVGRGVANSWCAAAARRASASVNGAGYASGD